MILVHWIYEYVILLNNTNKCSERLKISQLLYRIIYDDYNLSSYCKNAIIVNIEMTYTYRNILYFT